MSLFDQNIQTYIFKIDNASSDESIVYDQNEIEVGKLTGLRTNTKKLFHKDSLIFQINRKKKSIISTSTIWDVVNNDGEIIGFIKRDPLGFGSGTPDYIQVENKNGDVLGTFIPPDEYFSEKIEDKNGKKIAEFYFKKTKKLFKSYNHEYVFCLIDSHYERITLLALFVAIVGEKHSFYVHKQISTDYSGPDPSIELGDDTPFYKKL